MNILRREIRRHYKMKRHALTLNGKDMDTHCFSRNLRNYPLYCIYTVWYSLVRWIGLLFHYNQTAPEFVFNRAETASFRRSRTDSFGSYPSPIAMFTFVQTNRAKGGIRRMAPLIKRMAQESYLFVNRTMLLVMYAFVCGQEENSAFSCFYFILHNLSITSD